MSHDPASFRFEGRLPTVLAYQIETERDGNGKKLDELHA